MTTTKASVLFQVVVFLSGTLSALISYGQVKNGPNRISVNVTDVTLTTFLIQVESSVPYHFYFDQSQTDSLKVTINSTDEPFFDVLDRIVNDTEFNYAVASGNRVFITKDREIKTELPVDFFDSTAISTAYDVAALQYMGDEKKQKSEEDKLHAVGSKARRLKSGNATVTGNIRDIITGEPLPGALIFHEATGTGTSSDQLGNFSIALPVGINKIRVSYVGMTETYRQIILYGNGTLNIELKESVTSLKEVIVESERTANVTRTQMGLERIDARTMKQVPVVLGEADIVRVILTLPGVQSVGESSTGLNVRGGATSQNLILFNDGTIYNPAHLFGFFSAFNPDIIKNAELYKSGIPAEYGGRSSSVLEVNSKEGNKKKFGGAGGIGLITSRLMFEGPILKNKLSFLVGGRSSYSNWLLSRVPNKGIQNSRASFYDVNTLLSYDINKKNNVFLSAYLSSDRFKLNSDTVYSYQNRSVTLKWKHIFNEKLFGVFTAGHNGYGYSVRSDSNKVNAYDLSYGINQTNAKADLSYFYNAHHTITAGASTIYYDLLPGRLKPIHRESSVVFKSLERERAMESAVYVADQYEVSANFSVYFGLRYSLYNYLGPKTFYTYASGGPKDESTITDTVTYSSNKRINTYQGPEYRVSARYLLSENTSVKFGFQRMRQYIQMISNSTSISPTDVWKLSDPNIGPQIGDQLSVGLYKNFKSNLVEASVETYYKKMHDFLDYKGGAILTMNERLETDLIKTQGRAYGVEVMVKKNAGKLNGWISYTYSRSLLQTKNSESTETINEGKEYSSNFDKPHSVSLVGNYKFNRRINVAVNYVYSTGRPITIPLYAYDFNGSTRLYYSDRNQFRIEDYYRVDLALNLEGNHKIRKLAHSSWSLSVYNLTGRKNPYSVYFRSENSVIKGYKLSIFGRPIPTLTYNFKF